LFKTVADAEAAAKDGMVEIAGEKLRVAMHGTEGPMPMADTAKDGAKASRRNGGKKAAKKAVQNPTKDPKKSEEPKRVYNPEDDVRTVMVFGCSPKVTKEAVRARWPSAEAFPFHSRNKGPRGVMPVLFKTVADAEAAAKDGMVEIAGEKLRVAMHETPEQKAKRMDQRQRGVSVCSLPSGVTEADVLKAFPGAESASLHKNKQGEANGWATVILRTTEAAAAVSGVEVEVKGAKVTPFADGKRPPATKSSKKRKAAVLSSTVEPSTEPGEASNPPKKKLKKAAAN